MKSLIDKLSHAINLIVVSLCFTAAAMEAAPNYKVEVAVERVVCEGWSYWRLQC